MKVSRLLTWAAVTYFLVGSAFALWPYATLELFGVEPLSPRLGLDPDRRAACPSGR